MGRKLLVYMIDGTEYGPRTVEIGNWVGKAVYCNRANVSKILSRYEAESPGVYILKSSPTHNSFTERIYIGEAEVIGARLKQQLSDQNKDFEELVFFISKDHLLTKAHIKFLEARLIEDAHKAKSAEIENGTKPSLPLLHEAEISDLDYFLEQIKLILPLMGFKFLIPSTITNEIAKNVVEEQKQLFYIKSPSLKAQMYQSEKGFVVLKGSQAKKTMAPAVNDNYKALQQKLIETDLLVSKGSYFEFTQDTIFSTPSSAANIVLGRQTPGPITWLNSEGKTLKEVLQDIASS